MSMVYFILAVLVTVVVGASTVFVIYIAYIHRKYSHIPGPARASFFQGNNPDFIDAAIKGKPSCEVFLSWAKKYGRTFVVWNYHEPMVVTVAPYAVKDLLVTGEHPKSSRKYGAFSNLFGERFIGRAYAVEVDTSVWHARRALYNPRFRTRSCKDMMDGMNTVLNDMVEYLVRKADGKTSIQLAQLFNRVGLDFITQAFGTDGKSTKDENCPLTAAILSTMVGFDLMVKDSLFGGWKFWENQPVKRKARAACQAVRGIIGSWLDERTKSIEKGDYTPDDTITASIKASEVLSQGRETAIDDLFGMYIAGQETTANTLGFAILELGQQPAILKKLQQEVDGVLGTKGYISNDDLEKLPLTTRVFKEALRMYPAFPFHFRDVATDDYEIDGYKIHKGTLVHVNSFVSQRLAEHYADPDTFNPYRFESNSSYATYTYFPFLMGPRNCIGQTLAKMEAKIVLAKFIQRFDFEIHPTQRLGFQERTTLSPLDGLKVVIAERNL